MVSKSDIDTTLRHGANKDDDGDGGPKDTQATGKATGHSRFCVVVVFFYRGQKGCCDSQPPSPQYTKPLFTNEKGPLRHKMTPALRTPRGASPGSRPRGPADTSWQQHQHAQPTNNQEPGSYPPAAASSPATTTETTTVPTAIGRAPQVHTPHQAQPPRLRARDSSSCGHGARPGRSHGGERHVRAVARARAAHAVRHARAVRVGGARRPAGGVAHLFHRLPTLNMASHTGQACKNSTYHGPVRVGLAARDGVVVVAGRRAAVVVVGRIRPAAACGREVGLRGRLHIFHRLPTANMASPTGQACKNSTCHGPAPRASRRRRASRTPRARAARCPCRARTPHCRAREREDDNAPSQQCVFVGCRAIPFRRRR